MSAPPEAGPPSRHPLRRGVAWLVILACVSLFAASAYTGARSERSRSSQDPIADAQILLQSRYAMGWHSLFGKRLDQTKLTESLLGAVEKSARTPAEKLAIVPVVAELRGKVAAAAQLRTLAPQITDPDLQRDLEALRAIYEEKPTISQAQREALVARYRWLGRLALTWGQPEDSPERRGVLAAARRIAIAALAIVMVAIGGFFAGLVLFVIATIMLVKRRIRPLYRPAPHAPVHYLESFALYLVGMLGLSLAAGYLFGGAGLAPSALLVLLTFVLGWPASRLGMARTAAAIGWTLPSAAALPPPTLPALHAPKRGMLAGLPRPLREVICGVLGYLSGLPIVGAAMIVTLLLARLTETEPTHPIIEVAGRGWRVTLQLYLLACGVAPMVEETFFRGTLHHYLRGRHSFIVSALLSAVLFAVVHPQGWTTIPLLSAIGFVLSCLREWRGSLLAPMTAHALNNFTATTFLVVALS